MGIVPVPLTLDLTTGIFVGTEIKQGKLQTCPEMLTSIYPLDEDWTQHGSATWAKIGNDKVVVNNTDSGNYYLDNIHNIAQVVANPVHFRLIASGEGIPDHDGFSIKLILTDSGGLSGVHLGEELLRFPAGNFDEQQLSISITPTAPAQWLYAYIFTRYNTGKITMWNAEIYQDGDAQKPVGWWSSKPFDLAKEANVPIVKGGISLQNFAFKYGYIDNIDGMDNVDYSIEKLSEFDIVVTHEPSKLDARSTDVANALLGKGVGVYGYAQAGAYESEDMAGLVALSKPIMDNCAVAGYTGVFFDMFGYDYHQTRDFQNEMIDYAHLKGLKVFANAWRQTEVLDNTVDAVHNPDGTGTSMAVDDWVLLEGFYMISGSSPGYVGDEGDFVEYFNKYTETVRLANLLGVKVCGLTDVLSTIELTDTTDWTNAYCLAVGLGMHGLSYSQPLSSDNIDWPISTFLTPNIGSAIITTMKQVDSETYEAKTDTGVLQFIATDNPITRGHRIFAIPQKVFVHPITLPEINAQTHKITYYSSPDKVTWQKVQSLGAVLVVTDRYLNPEIVLRN